MDSRLGHCKLEALSFGRVQQIEICQYPVPLHARWRRTCPASTGSETNMHACKHRRRMCHGRGVACKGRYRSRPHSSYYVRDIYMPLRMRRHTQKLEIGSVASVVFAIICLCSCGCRSVSLGKVGADMCARVSRCMSWLFCSLCG
jgi:hypothetical protein